MRNPLIRFVLGAWVIVAAAAASVPCAAQQAGGGRIRQQDTFVSTNVLTPGETDEWPLAARDNETFIISVSSENFDPTLELVDPQGKVVAANDDVRAGEQDSLLLARVGAGGAYSVRVKASKSAAGGEYELKVRRFNATDAATGARTAAALGRTLSQWHRFTAEAGQTLVVTARAVSFAPLLEIYAPNGEEVEVQNTQTEQGARSRAVFRATQTGVYHVRVSSRGEAQPRSSYAVTVAVARVFEIVVGQPTEARPIDAGGLDLWTLQAEAGDLLKIETRAASGVMSAQMAFVPPLDKDGEPRPPEGATPPFVVLPSDPKATGSFVALVNLAGTYQVAVSQPLGVSTSYTLLTSRPLQPLRATEGGAPVSALALGGSDFWSVEGTAGQIMRFDAFSEQFDAALQLFNVRGELVSSDDDGGGQGRNSSLTAMLVEPGRYLLRVYAFGNGGSGAYKLSKVANPVRPLGMGVRADGTVGRGGSEIWSFKGQAGQTLIISARSADFDIKTALYSPDAAELASDDNGGEGTDSLLSVRLPLDGTYTLWVSAQAGGGKYSVRLIEAQ